MMDDEQQQLDALKGAVERELGPTAMQDAQRAFGDHAIVWTRSDAAGVRAPWVHLQRGRWAVEDGDDGLLLFDETIPGMARTIRLRDGAALSKTARPLGAPGSDN